MKRERGAEGAGRREYAPPEPLVCVECRTVSSFYAWSWRAYRIADPERHGAPTLAFYCPACADREFEGP
jgi:hypothetical protein